MGIRSDVAIALKKNVYDMLSVDSRNFLVEWFKEPFETEKEGYLFFTESVKWYHQSYTDIRAFYNELWNDFEDEDYLILKACHDYPTSKEGDDGEWHDNPWQIYRDVSVRINIG